MVQTIGGVLIDDIKDAWSATHVIATDGRQPIKRTPKLMIAISRTPNIVSLEWLISSAKAGSALPCDDFLVLDDHVAEKKYDFSMSETLSRVKMFVERDRYLLDGISIFVCDGVAGNKAPPLDELRMIVEAAGGRWLTLLDFWDGDSKLTIITSADASNQKKQERQRVVSSAVRDGASLKSVSLLFRCIMRQCDTSV